MDRRAGTTAGILLRVAAGDREAWQALCERHGDEVLHLARAIVGAHGAEDACHDAFVRLHRGSHRFRPGADADEHAQAWIRRLAINVCLDARRKSMRRRRREEPLEEDVVAKAHGTQESHPGRTEVLDALAALSERERILLTLRFWEGLDHRGIAAAVGCSEGAARVRLHRAIGRMRRGLLSAAPSLTARLIEGIMVDTRPGEPGGVPPTAQLLARLDGVPTLRGRLEWLLRGGSMAAAILAVVIAARVLSSPQPAPAVTPTTRNEAAALTASRSEPALPIATAANTMPADLRSGPGAMSSASQVHITFRDGPWVIFQYWEHPQDEATFFRMQEDPPWKAIRVRLRIASWPMDEAPPVSAQEHECCSLPQPVREALGDTEVVGWWGVKLSGPPAKANVCVGAGEATDATRHG